MQQRSAISRLIFTAATLGLWPLPDRRPSPRVRMGMPASSCSAALRSRCTERAGHVDVIVRRHRGAIGAVSVDLQTVDGSAVAGEDYAAATATLSWADGDHADKSLAIEILADEVVEGLETFGVVLSNPTGGVQIGALASTVVRIVPAGGGGTPPPPPPAPPMSRIRLRSAVFPAFEAPRDPRPSSSFVRGRAPAPRASTTPPSTAARPPARTTRRPPVR